MAAMDNVAQDVVYSLISIVHCALGFVNLRDLESWPLDPKMIT